ncbi:MAG TPA: hypothetical protein VMG82_16360 [Candidatus Sulfotelmatobacter sp.]|nr:hypothetical protein [Candidatus Sulfotelmatobacter sp.]
MSKVDIHSLLYPGATTKIYAHLLLWFGGSNHMNVGYSSTDPTQVHRQVTDMISRGINGVIIDWYGPNNSIDEATKLVMAEAEAHPGFTFAIMVDQGAIKWNSCSGCSPEEALLSQLQYIEQTYFPSPAYMTKEGRPIVTNFNIDLAYSIDWNEVTASLATQPAFLFQNNNGFTHVLSEGSYSWIMPTTSDYGMGYLGNFYNAGMALQSVQTVGATYKGFNDTLASWGSNRIMGQQCGQTWLQTFSEINRLYNSGKQLPALQLVTWNDYEEATEIESGINNCLSLAASGSGNSLSWTVKGNENTVDHYETFVSKDGQNLMPLGHANPGVGSSNLCSYSIPDGTYAFYVQAIGRPSFRNQISSGVQIQIQCETSSTGLSLKVSAPTMTLAPGGSGNVTVSVSPQSGSFDSAVALACSGLPSNLKCSFTPGSVVPGTTPASSVLTIAVTQSDATTERPVRSFYVANGLLGCGMFGIVFLGKVHRKHLFSIVAVVALGVAISGSLSCGNTSSAARSPAVPKNYIVTITGNGGSARASAAITVTVK